MNLNEEKGQEEGLRDVIPVNRPIINHAGISGGKDSTALMLWCLHESGYPKESLDFTFCDTDNEHDLTYDQIVMLSEHSVAHGGPKIQWLKPKRGFYELAKHKGFFPTPRFRYCTELLKIEPTKKYVTALVAGGADVVLHSGIRASESAERAKMVSREDIREHVSEYRPLLRWSIDDIWAIHKRYGIQPNPLYALGAKRVGCLPCIMSRKAEIALISAKAPERFDMIRRHESDALSWTVGDKVGSQFFHKGKTPRRFRTHTFKTSDGGFISVATIDDVVRWATFKPDYHTPDLFTELDTRAEDRTACQSTWGSCE